MKTSIRKAAKPAKLSASAKTLFADAKALDFKHLGWLKTSGGESITIAGFADMDGGIALGLAGASKGVFEPLAVDFFSHLDKQRKLTTTTFSLVIPQESRGIYKYSHPGVKLVSLLRKHKQYMRGLKATPVVHTKSLTDLAKSISDYLAYENQEDTESKKSADAPLSAEADRFLADATKKFNHKQDILKRKWRFDFYNQWGFDQVDGILKLEFADGSEFRADGQILGSYCANDCSWEWAWNNPHVADNMTRDAKAVKQTGERLGVSYLTGGIVPVPGEDFVSYLCAIGVKATNSIGVFRGNAGAVDVMIALKNPRWSSRKTKHALKRS